LVEFIGQLVLLVSEAESFGTDTANFFVACEQEPRFNLRGLCVAVDEPKKPPDGRAAFLLQFSFLSCYNLFSSKPENSGTGYNLFLHN